MNRNSKQIKVRLEWFAAYGLDKNKNLLQAPVCECGCGEKCHVLLNTKDDLFGFMTNMLIENDCNHCAMFAHTYDGKMYIAIKTDDNPDDSVTLYGIDKLDMEFFKKWNDKFDFHCYGLVVESKPGEWKIIED